MPLTYSEQVTIPGTYLVSHVALHANNLILRYEHGNTGSSFGKVEGFFKCPKLLIYQQPEAFDLKLFASRFMHLARNRALEIELSSGWNSVINGALHVRAATAGLRLQTSETSVIGGPFEVTNKLESGIVRFGAMDSGLIARLRLPFSLEHDVNDVSLKLEVSYTTKDGDYVFAISPSVSVMLPLGVNVQDVFKHKALYSRFTISSATSGPLRLLSTTLENSDVFQAQCGAALTRSLVIFPRQPASILYKITKFPSKISRSSSEKGSKAALSLVLHYICLDEEIDNAITLSLGKFFSESELRSHIRLIIPTVLSVLRRRMSPDDLEHAAVLSEVATSILSAVRWQDHLSGLGYNAQGDEDIATLLAEALAKWQQGNPRIPLIPLSIDEATIAASRSIIIPVEVPPVTVVHTANLKLLDAPSILSSSPVVPSTQPVSALLVIKWTRAWDTQSPESKSSQKSDDLEFVYDVSGPSDTWLIGGRRKGHFRIHANQNEALSFPIVLIPLRDGILPYPHVDIKPSSGSRHVQPEGAAITCETDYKNAGETIRVISDTRKTTVSLDASGPQGGAMLLEAERRTGEAGEAVLG
jgi:hypothetical protein